MEKYAYMMDIQGDYYSLHIMPGYTFKELNGIVLSHFLMQTLRIGFMWFHTWVLLNGPGKWN